MEIRALQSSDDRSAFQSGDEALDRFFRKYAGQNQFRHYLGVTYVAVEGSRVLGFATVAPCQLHVEELPDSTRRKVTRYPLPISSNSTRDPQEPEPTRRRRFMPKS